MADDHDDQESDDNGHDDHGDHGHGEDRPDYDPDDVDLPERSPPLRSTAPQSDFTGRQAGIGFAVLAVGLLVTFGVAVALV